MHFKGGVDKSQLKSIWASHILIMIIILCCFWGKPEYPTGVFDLSLADTSGSSSGVCLGETGSKEGYSNTSVLSLNDMLSCKKQILVQDRVDPSKCCHVLDFSDYFWLFC